MGGIGGSITKKKASAAFERARRGKGKGHINELELLTENLAFLKLSQVPKNEFCSRLQRISPQCPEQISKLVQRNQYKEISLNYYNIKSFESLSLGYQIYCQHW